MSCERYERELALHVEGDLPPRDASRLARHLEGCPHCRGFLSALEVSQRGVKALAAEPLDDSALVAVRAGLLAAVRERPAPARTTSVWGRALAAARWHRPLGAAVAVVVAALALGLFLWTGQEGRRRAHVEAPATVAQGAGDGRGTPALAADVSTSVRHEPGSTQRAPADERTRHSTARGPRRVSGDRAVEAEQAITALSPEDADQLARAIVVLSTIRRLSDAEKPPPAEPTLAGQVVLATSDPNVVIYWQLASNGG